MIWLRSYTIDDMIYNIADQVRTARYPLRFMLSGVAFVSLAFFYDSFMRLLPILGYLTAFDKYIYCLYLWLIASMVSLALMCRIFRSDHLRAALISNRTPPAAVTSLLSHGPARMTTLTDSSACVLPHHFPGTRSMTLIISKRASGLSF